jgi:hypothetical protein
VAVLGLRVSADGRTPSLDVAACRRGPYTARVEESSEQVRVEVRAAEREQTPAPACAEIVRVKLTSPLGRRVVVDATSGHRVPALDGAPLPGRDRD